QLLLRFGDAAKGRPAERCCRRLVLPASHPIADCWREASWVSRGSFSMSYRLFEVRVDLKANSFLRTTEMTQRANNVGAPPPRRDLRRHIHHHRPGRSAVYLPRRRDAEGV